MELVLEALLACLFAVAAWRAARLGLKALPLTLLFLSAAASLDVVLRATHLDHYLFAALGA